MQIDLIKRHLFACHDLRQRGLSIADVLTSQKCALEQISSDESQHFPEDDVLDSSSGAQYFLHRHESDLLGNTIHIHFFKRWKPKELHLKKHETITTHLVALALDSQGHPSQWFTVNQWVVGDYWQPADETVELFRNWKVSKPDDGRGDEVQRVGHEWLSTLIALHLDGDIKELLDERDARLDKLVDANPQINALNDRSIEVFGSRAFCECANHLTQKE